MVVAIILIAAVFVVRSIFRKARGQEDCGCSSCKMNAQCKTGTEKPDSCEGR
ncbi:MAG: FeoB-associated Cys-rich membrane protein [Thermodesulfobacteriota bacterium]